MMRTGGGIGSARPGSRTLRGPRRTLVPVCGHRARAQIRQGGLVRILPPPPSRWRATRPPGILGPHHPHRDHQHRAGHRSRRRCHRHRRNRATGRRLGRVRRARPAAAWSAAVPSPGHPGHCPALASPPRSLELDVPEPARPPTDPPRRSPFPRRVLRSVPACRGERDRRRVYRVSNMCLTLGAWLHEHTHREQHDEHHRVPVDDAGGGAAPDPARAAHPPRSAWRGR